MEKFLGVCMLPKFKVGEEVVICHARSIHDGETTVIESIKWSDKTPHSEYKSKLCKPGYIYKTNTMSEWNSDLWTETSLRKKHKPSDMSFNDLMSSIKSNVTT